MKRVGHFLDRHVGFRGSILVAFGFLDLIYAFSLATAADNVIETNATYRWFNAVTPLWVWALVWLATGIVCIAAALAHAHHWGFMGAIGIKLVWAMGSIFGWILDDVSPGGVGIWLVLAYIVWRVAGVSEPVVVSKDLEL